MSETERAGLRQRFARELATAGQLSFEEIRFGLDQALAKEAGNPDEWEKRPYVCEVFPTFCIYSVGFAAPYYQRGYAVVDGQVTLAPEKVEVEKAWVVVAREEFSAALAASRSGSVGEREGKAAGAAGGNGMDWKRFTSRLLGLSDAASDEELVLSAAQAVRSAQAEPVAGKVVELPEPAALSQGQPLKGVVTLSEAEAAQLRAQAAEAETLRQQVQEAQQAQALSQATAAVEGYITAGKITPAQREHALKFALQDPEAFAAMYETAPAVVPLGSRGNANLNRAAEQPQADSYEGLVLQKSAQEGLSLSDAAAEVARQRPELYAQYRAGVAGRQN